MRDPLAGGHAGESPYRHDPGARLSLTMGYARNPLYDSRYPWWLPPRDRCDWSPEIARKRTREMERDRQVHQMIDAAETLQLAETHFRKGARQSSEVIQSSLPLFFRIGLM